MARWLDIALSWKQRGATGAKWPRHQRRGKEIQHWDLKNPGDAFLYPYYHILYHIQFFRFISNPFKSIQAICISVMIASSIGWWFHIMSSLWHAFARIKAMPTACIQTDAWVQHSQCPKAIQHAGQLDCFFGLPSSQQYVSSCTVWCVGSRTETSAKSMPQICSARLHSQTSTVLGSVLCVSVGQWLNSWSLPSRHAAVRSILRLFRLYGSYISSGFCQSRSCTSTNISLENQPCNDMTLSSWKIKEV